MRQRSLLHNVNPAGLVRAPQGGLRGGLEMSLVVLKSRQASNCTAACTPRLLHQTALKLQGVNLCRPTRGAGAACPECSHFRNAPIHARRGADALAVAHGVL